MDHLLYLMFRCDGDVMKNLESLKILWELNTASVASSRAAPREGVRSVQGVDFLLRRPETELQSYIGVGGSHAVPHRIDRSRVVCRCCSCSLRRIRSCHRRRY